MISISNIGRRHSQQSAMTHQPLLNGFWKSAIVGIAVLACSFPTTLHAQKNNNFGQSGAPEAEGIELLQTEAYDMIRVKDSAKGGWAKVLPLPFPGRKLPRTTPQGFLEVSILGLPGKKFKIAWKDIEAIDLWEDRLARETRERIASGDFDGAYPFMAVMMRDLPENATLAELRANYLLRDGASHYQKKEWKETLAILEELRRFDPKFQTKVVLQKINEIIDTLMESMLEADDLENAQKLLSRISGDYKPSEIPTIERWNAQFLAMAEEKQAAAIAARDKKDFRAARKLARDSLHIYPKVPGGIELVKQIDTLYPLVRVGVLQRATVIDPTQLDNWPARRAGELVYRRLFEMRGVGPEGGEFEFLFGDTEQSDDRLEFDLNFSPNGTEPPLDKIDAYQVADALAARAQRTSPLYDPAWASSVEGISVTSPREIQCLLRRPHVLPASLLQVWVDGTWISDDPKTPTGAYKPDVREENLTRYVLTQRNKDFPTQPREVVEVDQINAADSVSALLRGEVDVLDRLFPADAERLRGSKKVRVGRYPLPSVHMLIPCSDHPYLAERTFRRALIYAINREDILTGELLEGKTVEGCRVISGPFPSGTEPDDPLGYAYNESVKPRPYQPRLAKLLMEMNQRQMKSEAEKKKEEMPAMTPIRIAVPADNVAAIAVQAIKTQLELLDVFPVEIVELPPGESMPKEGTADLVYVAASIWEPSIDARRLLGPNGLAGSQDQLVGLGLRRLETARNWKEVRDRLHDLHQTSNHELPILPLWQLVDSYAYRNEVVGIGRDIVSLYQNVRRWRLAL
ncbi:Bacterial extracellular solute-binding proteins, family 5 Middle [Roseimaritima multifibrata]|uniref:Bacterial extracellular solute-binding proteins, family 5 Middle n=2 Tax=Roseimaritima multifibrata TaxID=1930274 RepID=A0A517MM70_9BACT|nr:Bacterial extracellular solute-binding proteins, family 5 Middle [Roseimaritima multifibrata]